MQSHLLTNVFDKNIFDKNISLILHFFFLLLGENDTVQ